MNCKPLFFVTCVVLLSVTFVQAKVLLYVTKGTNGHSNDVELYWSPENQGDIYYTQTLGSFDLLVGNATPYEYHTGILDDGNTYYYDVEESILPCDTAGVLTSVDNIVGNMRCVLSGSFVQGSPTDPAEPCRGSDETQFTHILNRTLAVMETEVTRQMWVDIKAVQPTLQDDPSDTNYSPGMSHPVNRMTWYETILYANLLSLQNGFTRSYYTDATFTIPVDDTNYISDDIYCNFDATGYRLLSEGEWEYACRAGTTGPFSCDEDNYNSGTCTNCTASTWQAPASNEELWNHAVFCANNPGTSEPVGNKLANPWNLLDMHGNLIEWIWDWYTTYPSDTTDYAGPVSGTIRVFRGGFWSGHVNYCRSAFRSCIYPGDRSYSLGFRLARTVP